MVYVQKMLHLLFFLGQQLTCHLVFSDHLSQFLPEVLSQQICLLGCAALVSFSEGFDILKFGCF